MLLQHLNINDLQSKPLILELSLSRILLLVDSASTHTIDFYHKTNMCAKSLLSVAFLSGIIILLFLLLKIPSFLHKSVRSTTHGLWGNWQNFSCYYLGLGAWFPLLITFPNASFSLFGNCLSKYSSQEGWANAFIQLLLFWGVILPDLPIFLKFFKEV